MCQAWYVTSGYSNDYDNTRLWEFGIEAVMMGYYAMSIPAVLLHHGIKAFEVSVADAAAETET
eukprot:10458741-Ditylum_brightwellii.AAC.1